MACILGALAFAIHAWFDFPAHIPAVAIIATLLFTASMNRELIAVAKRRISRRDLPPVALSSAPLLRFRVE